MYSKKALISARYGFTLIELLSVIVVVGLLAAMLIPAISSVRQHSETTQCASNLRQLTTAAMIYATENRGNLLPPVDNRSGYQQWIFNREYFVILDEEQPENGDDLMPYFKCPTAQKNGSPRGYDYGMNISGVKIDGEAISGSNYKKSGSTPDMQPEDPSKAIYLLDGLDWWIKSSRATAQYSATGESNTTYTPAYRHNGGLNMSYYDGHVEYRTRQELTENLNDWSVSQ